LGKHAAWEGGSAAVASKLTLEVTLIFHHAPLRGREPVLRDPTRAVFGSRRWGLRVVAWSSEEHAVVT
jgi:hypothetical protein